MPGHVTTAQAATLTRVLVRPGVSEADRLAIVKDVLANTVREVV